MESFEHMGYWWLPDEPETKVPGTISFDPVSGGELEIHIEGQDIDSGFNTTFHPVILGTVHTEQFSLVGCRRTVTIKRKRRGFLSQKMRFIAETIFEGHHFMSVDELAFEYISASYTYLDDWMNQGVIRFNGGVRYRSVESTTVHLQDFRVSFRAGVRTKTRSKDTIVREANVKQVSWVNVRPNRKLPFGEYHELIDIHIPDFLSLATGMPNYPSNVHTVLKRDDLPVHVKVYYQVSGYVENPEAMSTESMLFSFQDVNSDPSKHLPNWISKSVDLQTVYDLYHQTVYSKLMHFRTQFLLLAQALEAYHRNLYDEKYSPKLSRQDKRCLKNAIPGRIEGEHRNNLNASIDRGNDLSLKARIVKICDSVLRNHLVNGTIVIVEELIGDVDEFAEKVKATRNYLTHHPKKRSKKVLSDEEIVEYIRKMQLLLRICLLVELAFPPEKIKERVIANSDFKRVTGHW